MNTHEVFFHEDDYCQQEILPLAALDFCKSQLIEIDEFASNHLSENGVGWTDMRIRDDSPQKLSDLGITIELFRTVMQQYLPEIAAVYTGYSSYRELCQRTTAFGYHADCIIYANWNDQGVVEQVWTAIFSENEEELKYVVLALQHLGQQFSLIYVDWAWSFVVPIDQSTHLHSTLAAKTAEIRQRVAEWGDA